MKENIRGHEHNVARNRNITVVSGEISEGKGEHDRGKVIPVYEVAKI